MVLSSNWTLLPYFGATQPTERNARVLAVGLPEALRRRDPDRAIRASDSPSVFKRLHHVQLAIPQGGEAAARAFYAVVLGMTEVNKPRTLARRGGAWFRAGSVELHLGVEDEFQPARKAHPAVLVDSLDEVVKRLASAGQSVSPDTDLPGFQRVYAEDPFGNRLEFLEPSE
jgi:catechol 2,3-dioxygenase-like lactoylglutathione lyase family enzyme